MTLTHARTMSGATAWRTTKNPSAEKSLIDTVISFSCGETQRRASGNGHASHRDVEGALGGGLQVRPVASIRHVRLACQPDVDLAAAEPRLELRHGEAIRGIVARGFPAEINALPGWIPGLPVAEPGEIVEEVAVHRAAPVQHTGDAVG